MKKERFYVILIVVLVLLNAGVISFMLMRGGCGGPDGRPGEGPPGGRPDGLIIERLKLDGDQRHKFEALRDEHHSQMVKIGHASADIHKQLFDLLKKQPIDTVERNRLIGLEAANAREKELATFDHFQKLRGILRPEQQPLFDDLVQELSRFFMGPPPPPGRRPE